MKKKMKYHSITATILYGNTKQRIVLELYKRCPIGSFRRLKNCGANRNKKLYVGIDDSLRN